jgi:hypothetical protein
MRPAEETTLFKNIGGAHLDLFTAHYLLRRMADNIRKALSIGEPLSP